jgi:hypothetical protein
MIDPLMEKHRALMAGMTEAGLLPSGPAPDLPERLAREMYEWEWPGRWAETPDQDI